MKFKDLTNEQKDHIKKVYKDKDMSWDDRMAILVDFLGKSERTVRKWCSEKLNLKERVEVESEQFELAKTKEIDKSKKYYLVSWCQNNTAVHKKFLKNMQSYSEFLGGEIVIIPGRYRNPTTLNGEKEEEFWASEVAPYLSAKRHDIHKYLTIMGDIKTQPTAINPMSGMEGMSKDNSCIFGHPKVHLQMIPVLNGYKPKMMLTTGSCSKMNYSDSKVGKKSEFHHQYGFTIVELEDDKIFHVRQVTALDGDGSFYDLCHHVKDGSVSKINKLESIVLGDLHYGEHDEVVMAQTFKLMDKLKPKNVVLEDVLDCNTVSHHTIDNPFIQYGKEVNNENSLKDEVEGTLDYLGKFKKFDNVIIVRSNHDVHLDKFLLNDWRKLPTSKNSLVYMEYAQMLLKQHADGKVIGIIPELINKRYPKYKTLQYNDSYKICGFEVSQHGEYGSNGARGAINTFRKYSTKIITAHTHTPSRFDNAICVGTSTKLKLSYNQQGGSSWLQSHVLIFPNSKCQHINFIGKDKSFTTFKL
jgi:hypothetical protein